MTALIEFLNTPLGAAVLVMVSLFGARQFPLAWPLVEKALRRKGIPIGTPPALPSPTPAEPDRPRPLIDAARHLIEDLARRKFSWLPPEQAVARYAAEKLAEHQADEKQQAEAAVVRSEA